MNPHTLVPRVILSKRVKLKFISNSRSDVQLLKELGIIFMKEKNIENFEIGTAWMFSSAKMIPKRAGILSRTPIDASLSTLIWPNARRSRPLGKVSNGRLPFCQASRRLEFQRSVFERGNVVLRGAPPLGRFGGSRLNYRRRGGAMPSPHSTSPSPPLHDTYNNSYYSHEEDVEEDPGTVGGGLGGAWNHPTYQKLSTRRAAIATEAAKVFSTTKDVNIFYIGMNVQAFLQARSIYVSWRTVFACMLFQGSTPPVKGMYYCAFISAFPD
ncbi:unnamed protein product [Nesidiocoris tenuis]|uniref:Uncharacterized protein n=1 Tax=Nesidiocoris tenuis TaxID=355587 RepID=A0A6H5H1G7_9HEMI|nr:unnamed protein product [Nesidiocoris tenuis]